jgi:macrolide-specific efflux system membrane fusion protein
MKNKKFWLSLILLLIIIGVIALVAKTKPTKAPEKAVQEIGLSYGDIQTVIKSNGSVQPQNRLEIKPATNGRVEEILVKEGDKVTKGSVLAWMSSAERASVLDAITTEGEEAIKYWKEVYKPMPIVAPIDGEVIVRAIEPGQTVTSATAILVLSDRLIVKAVVDETDIGKVKVGQEAIVSLDAYPEVKIEGKVSHIAYESTVINNVNTYAVNIMPETVPEVFRSGMSTTIKIISEKKENVLLIPREAVQEDKEGSFVLLNELRDGKYAVRRIKLGIFDDKNFEVISGLSKNDKVIIEKKASLPKKKQL